MAQSAHVNYHIHSAEAQAFQFDVGGNIGELVSPQLQSVEVSLQDLRGHVDDVNFNEDGVEFVSHRSDITDFESNDTWYTRYERELTQLLKATIGAKEVLVFDHTVRIDDPEATRKPARNVHNDYSPFGADQRLIDLVGPKQAKLYREGHYAFVNIWRPIEHVIQSSPLGFIRPSSMEDEDWMDIELIYPDRKGQILGVSANHNHKWFYLSEMTPNEAAIFNIHDNRGQPSVAHSALDLAPDNGRTATVPRKSIESRTLVRYD